ncbi:MAG TPA: hypothetical protein VFG87_05910 [Amycolatopsis sp.]|jgi:uncharacterized protein YukE|nr:hypothetical protein [Amycolatopsis sp.]
MTTFSVQFPAVSDAIDGINGVYNQLSTSGENLIATSKAATSDMKGQTLDQMSQVHNAYYQAHGEFTDAVNNANRVLGQINEEYQNGERSAAAPWQV